MSRGPSVVVVLTTFPDRETAVSIAGRLVNERLAACVNLIDGVTSIYLWQGSRQSDSETLAVIKTGVRTLEALTSRLVALHPYELPEVVALPAEGGSPDYLRWVLANSTNMEGNDDDGSEQKG